MKLVYKGKTKDVYALASGEYLLQFKDDVTGTDGVFDPGANTVGLSIKGIGKSGLKLSTYFFDKINKAGIPTHFISADIDNATMTVKPAKFFGEGLEVILRYKAVGSFIRRYGKYCKDGQELDAYVEVTLKDDDRNDPLITSEALSQLGILTFQQYDTLVSLTKEIGSIIKQELASKQLELYDIKLEFGLVDNNIVALIDEISGGNLRAYKNGNYIEPFLLEQIMLTE